MDEHVIAIKIKTDEPLRFTELERILRGCMDPAKPPFFPLRLMKVGEENRTTNKTQ